MAIAVVQSASGGGLIASSGGTFGVTLSSAPSTSNMLLAIGASDGLTRASTSPGSAFNYVSGRVTGTAADLIAMYLYGASAAAESPLFATTEANIYNTAVLLELSGGQASGGYSAQTSSTNTPPASQKYTAPSITTPGPANGVGILMSCFAIEDYNGITSATPPSGWTLLGPFAQNGGATTPTPIKLYVMYLLAPTNSTAYTPVLTYVGTPTTTSGTIQSFCINNFTAAAATRRRKSQYYILAH